MINSYNAIIRSLYTKLLGIMISKKVAKPPESVRKNNWMYQKSRRTHKNYVFNKGTNISLWTKYLHPSCLVDPRPYILYNEYPKNNDWMLHWSFRKKRPYVYNIRTKSSLWITSNGNPI